MITRTEPIKILKTGILVLSEDDGLMNYGLLAYKLPDYRLKYID